MRTMVKEDEFLEKEFDFSKSIKNPYIKRLRKSITMNVDLEALDYFKRQSSESGIPYQTLINLYLVDCAKHQKKLDLSWH